MDLYNATGGPQWLKNANWGTARVGTHKWFGVRMDWRGRCIPYMGSIISLDLRRNNLVGELPQSFIDAMEYSAITPKLWGNPRLEGIPVHWQRHYHWYVYSQLVSFDISQVFLDTLMARQERGRGSKGLRRAPVCVQDKRVSGNLSGNRRG